MGTQAVLRSRFPRATDQLGRPLSFFGRLGDHVLFYGRAIAGMPHAAVHFRREIIRLIAEISMGAGTLAMIGGTVVIVGFLTLSTGALIAVQGYNTLSNVGIEALTGFLGALALVLYVCVYTPMKQKSWTALLIGAVPGALPPLMGWTAATGKLVKRKLKDSYLEVQP